VTTADIGEKLGEQVAIARALPQMMVGIDDRQAGFEDVLGWAGRASRPGPAPAMRASPAVRPAPPALARARSWDVMAAAPTSPALAVSNARREIAAFGR